MRALRFLAEAASVTLYGLAPFVSIEKEIPHHG